MGKLSFVAGVAVGYVLGTRAGRQRYEQIKGQAGRLWSSDPVQDRVGEATERIKTQAAPFVADKLGDAVKAMGQQVRGQAHTEHLPETIHRGTDGKLHADMTGMGPGPDKLP